MHPANQCLKEYTKPLFFRPAPTDVAIIDPALIGIRISADEAAMREVTVKGAVMLQKMIPFHTSSATKTYRRYEGRVAVLTWQNGEFHRNDLSCDAPYIVPANVPHAMIFEAGDAKFHVSFSVANPPPPVWLEGSEELLQNRH